MKKLFTLFLFVFVTISMNAQLIITGVLDGPLSNGTKVMEIYAASDIPDLSIYGVELVSNGGGSTGVEYTFPAIALTAGEFAYLANIEQNCIDFLGVTPIDVSTLVMNFNGNDALILYENGAAVDAFGMSDMNGTGTTWEYLDTWAYRVDFTGPDGGTFVEANWTFGMINDMDNQTTNTGAPNPFPMGTYQYAAPADPVVSFSGNADFVTESVGTYNIMVNITGENANPTSVDIIVDAGSTVDGSDYSLSTTTVTFPANSNTSQVVTVTVNDDALAEVGEILVLNLDSPTNSATIGGNSSFSLIINDNDTPIPDLVINEIMYNVFSFDTLEFIEIHNYGTTAVDMEGFSISGVNYNFVTSTIIDAGGYFVVCNNAAAFQSAFGMSPAEWPGGQGLNNTGETITLSDASDNVIDEVTYSDAFPFPMEPDGFGPSLELCDPLQDNSNGVYWLPSMASTGYMIDTVELMASPGMMNTVMCPTVINPTLSFIGNSATYNEDAGTVTVEVEIINGNDMPTNVTVSVDGMSTATDMSDYTYTETTLTFAANVAMDTQMVTLAIVDDMDQESLENIILNLTANDNNSELQTSTYTVNINDNDTPPADLVITEIMYNDPGTGLDSLEYIEFVNNGTTAVDVLGVSFTSGVTHTIQTSMMLQPGDFYVVCVNAVEFQNAFGFAADDQWASGGLNNTGEMIILNDGSGIPVDSVEYSDTAFPSEADGGGPSLELCTDFSVDNNDAANWYASTTGTGFILNGIEVLATPGAANTTMCGTVIEDPVISFSSDAITVDEDAGTITVDVTLAMGNANDTEVTVTATAASTAEDGTDFTYSPSTITFMGGNATGTETISINIADDTETESDETIVLAISGNNGATTGANSTYTVTIVDNDPISVDDIFKGNVSILPNPVSDVLHIRSEIQIDNINIFNILGQNRYSNDSITPNTSIDMNQWEKGIYFVHLISGESKATYQIVVE